MIVREGDIILQMKEFLMANTEMIDMNNNNKIPKRYSKTKAIDLRVKRKK